jgi:phosphoglycolate phosphatase
MAAPLLVFDLDGTLVDSAPDLLATLREVLRGYGFEVEPDPDLRNGIGHGARHLIEYALHRRRVALDDARLAHIYADYLRYYEANIATYTRPYTGLVEMLDRFAAVGWSFAVCTNKLEGLSRTLLESLGLAHRFSAICGGDTFAARKPDPHHLLGTIALAGGSEREAIMVGDSRTDLDTARAAGIPFVGVSFGYTPVPMAQLRPDLLLDRFDDLTPATAANLVAGASGHAGAAPALT